MRERNSENFLAIDQPFLSKLFQVFIIESVGDGNVYVGIFVIATESILPYSPPSSARLDLEAQKAGKPVRFRDLIVRH